MDIDAVHGAVTNYRLEAIETIIPAASPGTQAVPDTPAPATTEPTPSTQAPSGTTPPAPSGSQSTPSPSSSSSGEITSERAKEIALTKVGSGTVTKCNFDYENGRKVYEIKIVYGNTKWMLTPSPARFQTIQWKPSRVPPAVNG